jgi:hypothetical protein
MGVGCGDKFFQLSFEAFEYAGAKVVGAEATSGLDFTLVQEPDAWRAMLSNIKENGLAESEFTLNSLDLRSEVEFAVGEDYNRRDLFYRFNQTFQEYFDQSSQMETTFA